MTKWITLVIGLIILALGIVVLVEGSQEIVGIVITAISGFVILPGIVKLIKRMPKSPKETKTTEPDEEPPVF